MADFVFATCLPGMEPALKLDLARGRPDLRLSYSRPGLVTFKSARPVAPEDLPGSPFARAWGRSIGAAGDPAAASNQLSGLGVTRVHVFAREPGPERLRVNLVPSRRDRRSSPGEADPQSERIERFSSSAPGADPELPPDVVLDRARWQALGPGGPAEPGELVADVIVDPAPGQPAWLGLHRHDRSRSPHPGGAVPVELPEDAPSRAYAKIEEAIAWAGLPVARGQIALEIGAAPGGAVLALARRGLEVWAVDTGALAPQVAALPAVHHVAKKVGALRWEELPPRIDWLLVDVNLAPQVALHEVARLMPRLGPTLRGAVFTLKLNDWSFVAELPALVERIRQMGLAQVRLSHLPSNRREVCAVAVHRGSRT